MFALRVRCKFSNPLPPLKHQVWYGSKEIVSENYKMAEANFDFLGEASMRMFGLFAVGFPLASTQNVIEITSAAEISEVLNEKGKMMVRTIEKVQNLLVKID